MTTATATLMSQPWVTDLGNWLQADGPTPTPSPTEVLRPGLSKWDVTPGLLGFLAMFCVVLAAVAVWFSMSGKLRKIQHDERRQASAAQARADATLPAVDPTFEDATPEEPTAGDSKAPSTDPTEPDDQNPAGATSSSDLPN